MIMTDGEFLGGLIAGILVYWVADSVITAETGKAMNEHGADLYNSAKDTISNVITP